MQPHKTSNQRIAVCRYDSSIEHDNSNKTFQLSIAPHFPDAIQFP